MQNRSWKIVQICTSRSWGGMEMQVPILCEKLRERGHTVLPVCYPQSRIQKDLQSRGFETFELKLTGYFHPLGISRLAKLFRNFCPDIVHSHYSRDLWTIIPAFKLAPRVPLVFTKHIGTRVHKIDLLHRWLYSQVDRVIAISDAISNNFRITHRFPPEKITVINPGVDLEKFSFKKENRDSVRQELGITSNQMVIGIIGRLQIGKGYLEFLQMAKIIKPVNPQAKFLIVGEATYGETKEADLILNKIDEWELKDCVILTGFRKDVPGLLSAMDIFVFPTHSEAFGMVLVEAMAAGLPIVSTDKYGVLDIVIQEKTGFLVPPKDVPQLTESVLALISDENKRKTLGEKGRTRAENHFDIEKITDRLEQVYFELIYNR